MFFYLTSKGLTLSLEFKAISCLQTPQARATESFLFAVVGNREMAELLSPRCLLLVVWRGEARGMAELLSSLLPLHDLARGGPKLQRPFHARCSSPPSLIMYNRGMASRDVVMYYAKRQVCEIAACRVLCILEGVHIRCAHPWPMPCADHRFHIIRAGAGTPPGGPQFLERAGCED